MSPPKEILALVFDFDDTLVHDSTTALLSAHGIDTARFWRHDARELIDRGFDPTVAYLQLLLVNIGKGKPLGQLTNKRLHDFGASLDKHFYPGLPRLFADLKREVGRFQGIHIEFYIVSSGLLSLIRGSELVQRYFQAVYASELAETNDTGILAQIKQCVTFTEKTRFLFEIQKGVNQAETRKNPYLVNTSIPELRRRIPFRNMIYVGDGITDIPCFSLIKQHGGTAFGVFHPHREHSARRAFLEFLKTDRVVSCHAPKYRRSDELGALLRTAVIARCNSINLERQHTAN